jgi:itaconate CoA-transferase
VRFCTHVLGRPDVATDSRFASGALRVEHRTELEALADEIFATLTIEELETRLAAAAIGPVPALGEHIAAILAELDHPS